MKTKKLLSAVFALTLAMGLSVTASAAGEPVNHDRVPSSETIGVKGYYNGTGTAADTYSVDIEWGEMSFTYNTTGDKKWDPTNHTYDVAEGDGWQATGNTVTVTNHSNVPVNVEFSFVKDTSTYKGEYVGKLSINDIPVVAGKKELLEAGVENKYDEADSVECKLEFENKLNYNVKDPSTKLGDIIVSLTEVTDNVEP